VLKRHREIFYGLLFGLGAALIDTFIDSKMQDTPFWEVSIGMALYRILFVIFGCILGWLLWRKNESEREFRSLLGEMQKLRQEIGTPVTMIHAQTQLLLAKPGSRLPPEVESAVRTIYEQSQRLHSINREHTARVA